MTAQGEYQKQIIDELTSALAPVLRDLRRSGIGGWRIDDADWIDDPEIVSATFHIGDSGTGFSFVRSDPECERVASVADGIHEVLAEELAFREQPTNWPRCPHHPTTHPLRALVIDQTAVWWCPTNQAVVAPIGECPFPT